MAKISEKDIAKAIKDGRSVTNKTGKKVAPLMGENQQLLFMLVEALTEHFQGEIDAMIRDIIQDKIGDQIQSLDRLAESIGKISNNPERDKVIKNGLDAIFSNMTKEGQAIITGMKKLGTEIGKNIASISIEIPEGPEPIREWSMDFDRDGRGFIAPPIKLKAVG